MMLIDRIIKFHWYLIALLLLGGYGLVNGSVVYASEFTHSQALPSSDPNYRVELIDPPNEGYELYRGIPMRVHVNNNTGKELKNFKIQYVIKKDVTSTGDLQGVSFNEYLEFKNKPSIYNFNFATDSNYLVPTLERNVLPQLTEDFDITLNYKVRDSYINVAHFDKVLQSWLVDGDTEIQVRFLSGNEVLAEQTLQLKKRNVKPDYRLRLVHKNYDDVEVTNYRPLTITNEGTRYANLQIAPVVGAEKPIPQFPSRFTFHLPEGVSFVKSEWDKRYYNVPVDIKGQDVTIELPAYLVGLGQVFSTNNIRRMLNYYYINVPIKFEGTVKPTYQFTVDSEDIPNIKPYVVDNKLIKQVDPLDLVKDTDTSALKLRDGDYTTVVADLTNKGFDIQSSRFSVIQRGLRLKQFGIVDSSPQTKVFGIKSDGSKVELQPILRDLDNELYYEKSYYRVKAVYKDLDDYEDIEINYGHNFNDSRVYWTYEIVNKGDLQTRLPVTYLVEGREKTVNVNVSYTEPIFDVRLTQRSKVFINQTRGDLYDLSTFRVNLQHTPYKEHHQGYVIYRYEKGMTLRHDGYEKLVQRETIGDYVYDLTQVIDYGSRVDNQYADFSPVFQDGVHRVTGKIFFNHDNNLPDSIADSTVRQPYDETRSLKDNYDNSTNKEYVMDFTYQSPRSLQVAALINGTTGINVVNTDEVYTFEHYLMNKSTQSYSGVEGEITLPKEVVLTELVTTDSRYKVLYKVGDSWVENPTNLEDVTGYKVLPKEQDTTLGLQDIVKTVAKVRVKDVSYGTKLVIGSKMLVNGVSTKAQDVVLDITDKRLADGTLKIQYVNLDGDLLKEDTLRGRDGTNYEVNVTDFEKDGKNYGFDHVDGDLNGSYEGTKTKVVKVYMKEKPRVYELPVSGKLDFIWVLFSLLGILVITGKHKKIKV